MSLASSSLTLAWSVLGDAGGEGKLLSSGPFCAFGRSVGISQTGSTVAFPVAISHKVSVDTKLRFFNPDAKNFTLGPHAQLSKRTKEKQFHGPIFGTVWRYQK